MSKFDYLSLDGNSLLTFIMVLEEMSVTKAAERLGVTQSAVSHTLDKLRAALGDPLFVRSGRSIAATEQALALLEPAHEALNKLKELTDHRHFDPNVEEMEFKVAANDFTRSIIFPALTTMMHEQSIDIRFSFLPARIPDFSMLRRGLCDLLITPYPPEGTDIFQVRIFSDDLKCFFDGTKRNAPATKKELIIANHLDVIFEDQTSVMRTVFSDLEFTKIPKPRISVPNFDAVSEFILGTDLITIQLGRMAKANLKDLDCSALPFKTKKQHIYLAWHRRDKNDPAHIWLRKLIRAYVK